MSGADADRVVADALGMHSEFLAFGNDRIDAVEETLVKWWKRILRPFLHHASNSSGVVEGWAAVLLASPNYAKAHGLKPHARVVAMVNMGDSPPDDE
jgi:acetyl-CoA acetyltransferase